MSEYLAEQYCDDVLDGKILTCEWVKLAVKRHRNDLKRQKTEGFPYYFCEKRAKKIIDFFHTYLYHVKGERANRKEKIKLTPSWQFILWSLFGWRKWPIPEGEEEGYRKYNIAYISTAKKSAKSTVAAGLGIFLFRFDGEAGAEVYSAAATKDQAKIVWKIARAMVLKNIELRKYIQPYKDILIDDETFSSFEAVSSDADPLDGRHVHGAIIDEYHAHKTNEVYDILQKGTIARPQPLVLIVTTAGFDPGVPCRIEEEYAQQILAGRFINESYFAIVYTLDKGDDPHDEKTWIKANPSLGVTFEIEELQKQYIKAKDIPREWNRFKTKHLNIWTQAEEIWIKEDKWKACENNFPVADLAGAVCYAGGDLSTTLDISGYCLAFPPCAKWNKYRLLWRFYIPSADLEERVRRDRVPYDLWIEQGFVVATEGATIDYDYIQADLLKDMELYDVREFGCDPHNASQFITNLHKAGLEEKVFAFPQGWAHISPAAKDFEKKTLDKMIEFAFNPVIDWMISCTSVKSDLNGNIHPVKPERNKTSKRIDGVMMAIMALDRAVRNYEAPSIYETRGVVVL